VMLSVPAVYHRLLDAGLAPTPAFRALRHYVSAGERLPPQIWSRAAEERDELARRERNGGMNV